MCWRRRDAARDIVPEAFKCIAQLRLWHQLCSGMVAARRQPLAEHHLHPAVDAEEVVRILKYMRGLGE
jgi:hypothetical protein